MACKWRKMVECGWSMQVGETEELGNISPADRETYGRRGRLIWYFFRYVSLLASSFNPNAFEIRLIYQVEVTGWSKRHIVRTARHRQSKAWYSSSISCIPNQTKYI